MTRAGLESLHEVGRHDEEHLVTAIYMAMEYERLDALGKL